MLKAVGFVENEGQWEEDKEDANEALHLDPEVSNSIEVVAKEAERLNAADKPIVPQLIAENIGLKIPVVVERLKELGYIKTNDIDPITHLCSWKKGVMDNSTSFG